MEKKRKTESLVGRQKVSPLISIYLTFNLADSERGLKQKTLLKEYTVK